LLQAGVYTVDEVRAMRGLSPMEKGGTTQLSGGAAEAATVQAE
jgi:hypothetical protein